MRKCSTDNRALLYCILFSKYVASLRNSIQLPISSSILSPVGAVVQLCYVEITRKLSRDKDKTTFVMSRSRENEKEKNNNAWPLRTSV